MITTHQLIGGGLTAPVVRRMSMDWSSRHTLRYGWKAGWDSRAQWLRRWRRR